ncbi:MAG: hypothetical protein HY959_12630 [Ignavibacteriae bacterium]|nr:hypothetical protein [Ignavibacteriota bacterium]
MKNSSTLILLLCFIIPAGQIFSQELSPQKKAKPFIEINVSGGYNYSLFDLKGSGDLRSFWSLSDYAMGSGFGTNANIKLGVFASRMLQLKIKMELSYSHFSNSDSRAYSVGPVDMGWPNKTFPNINTPYYPRDTAGVSSLRLNMPGMGFGLECSVFTDRDNKSAFNFGLDLMATLITGRAHETIQNSNESYVTINPSLRFGVGLNSSYSYRFEDWVGFHVGTKFTLPNIFSKSSEMTDQAGYISLLDDSNTALNPLLKTKRIIGFMQLFAGITFYMGRM